MSGGEEGPRPTPAMMPRRRPEISPAQRPPARSTFKAAVGMPRRGLPDSIVWLDTGVLLGLGADKGLLDRFRRHYGHRIRLTKNVARELRGHSKIATDDLADDDYDRVMAAIAAVQALLIGPDRLGLVEAGDQDLPEIVQVGEQLKARSEDRSKRHGGEAEIIVLAARQARIDGRTHVLLTNDGGASVIADHHGLPARHIGDVIAELACADLALDPEACLEAFRNAVRLSAPPARSRQSGIADFTCTATSSGCTQCDARVRSG